MWTRKHSEWQTRVITQQVIEVPCTPGVVKSFRWINLLGPKSRCHTFLKQQKSQQQQRQLQSFHVSNHASWDYCASNSGDAAPQTHMKTHKGITVIAPKICAICTKKKKKEKMQASLRRVQVNVTAAVFFIQKASCVWCVWFSAVQTKNSSWFWTSWMFPVHVLPAAHYPPLLPSPFVRHVSCRPPRHKPCAAKVHNIRVIRQVIIMRWGWQHDGTVRRVSLSLLLSSQLSVPLPCVPAEAGAAAHHGEDGAQQQGQSVARVVRLRRGDQGEQQQADEGCCVRKFKFGSHVELFFFHAVGCWLFGKLGLRLRHSQMTAGLPGALSQWQSSFILTLLDASPPSP